MIYESGYWKSDLLRIATRLVKRTREHSREDRIMVRTEKDLFIGCYTIRKLIESKKITESTAGIKVSVISYPWLGKRVDIANKGVWHELYNFDHGTVSNVTLAEFYNRFIHSYVFDQVFEDEKESLVGFYVNSDRNRNSSLYYIEALEVVQVFRAAGRDRVTSVTWEYDSKLQERVITEIS